MNKLKPVDYIRLRNEKRYVYNDLVEKAYKRYLNSPDLRQIIEKIYKRMDREVAKLYGNFKN